jgi:hypothetical protein
MTEQERQNLVYDEAMAKIREKERVEQGFAGGLVAMALTLQDMDKLQSWGEWARTFCLLFAMALPPFFVWALLLS